jgi:hypothetical protein
MSRADMTTQLTVEDYMQDKVCWAVNRGKTGNNDANSYYSETAVNCVF